MNILIIGGDSDIAVALNMELILAGHNVKRFTRNQLDVRSNPTSWPVIAEKYDQVFYCIGVGGVHGDEEEIMLTNSLYSFKCLQYIAPHVKNDGAIRVLSSAVGSLTSAHKDGAERGNIVYRMSKAALNMGVIKLSQDFSNIRWQLIHPGFVKTKMTLSSPLLSYAIDPKESAIKILRLSVPKQLSFKNFDGKDIDW